MNSIIQAKEIQGAEASILQAEKRIEHLKKREIEMRKPRQAGEGGSFDETLIYKAEENLARSRARLEYVKNPPKQPSPEQRHIAALEKLTEYERRNGHKRPGVRENHINALKRLGVTV